MRISLVTNMAREGGAVPAGLRRRFWRTAANVWRMVNGRLSLLSLPRQVAGKKQPRRGGGGGGGNRGPGGGEVEEKGEWRAGAGAEGLPPPRPCPRRGGP